MKRLVFICSGNTCRSPMAKGLFIKHLEERNPELKDKIEVVTAGTQPNTEDMASPGALAAMGEVGVDISEHRPQPVTQEILSEADWILTMTRGHRDYLIRTFGDNDKLYTINEFLGQDKDVLDPYGGDLDTYRSCRDELQQLIEMLAEKLKSEIG
ncbi:MAG: low molecular weight protein arginine phosphatase [Bacillota bacterium]